MTTEKECKNCEDEGKCLVSCPECCKCGRSLKRYDGNNYYIRASKHNQKTLLIETAAVIAARVEPIETVEKLDHRGPSDTPRYPSDYDVAERAIGIARCIIEMALHGEE